jgi:CheY-like chemotaxis protein
VGTLTEELEWPVPIFLGHLPDKSHRPQKPAHEGRSEHPRQPVPVHDVGREAALAKVLVIDDEPTVRTITKIILSRLGYEVLVADNGRQGLELNHREHPDVVVLGLTMPEMDGVDVLTQIRKVDHRQPVIIMTGDCRPEVEQQIRALGISEFIIKGDATLQALRDALTRLFPVLPLIVAV